MSLSAEPIQAAKSTSQLDSSLVLIGLMVFGVGQTMIFAIAGPASRLMGLTETDLGLVISLAAVSYTLSVPLWGRLGDRIGRIRILSGALIFYALATIVFAGIMDMGMAGLVLAPLSFFALVATRVVLSVGVGGIYPCATAYMVDVTDVSRRTAGVALVGAAFGLGSVMGPVLAGALTVYGLLFPIYASALLAFVLGVAIFLKVREPERMVVEKPTKLSFFGGNALPFVLMALGTFTVVSILQQTSAFYFQDRFGFSSVETAQTVGIAMGSSAFAMLVVQGGLVQFLKFNPRTFVAMGCLLACLGLAATQMVSSLSGLYFAYGVFGSGTGLINPGIMAGASLRVGPDHQGAVAGLVGAGMGAGYIIGPILGTSLYRLDMNYPFILGAVLMMVLFLMSFRLSAERKSK